MHNKSATYVIHGETWRADDLAEALGHCRGLAWSHARWKPRAALLDSSGTVTEYIGQSYDPAKFSLQPSGWAHDHCEVCTWKLSESPEPAVGAGYTHDGRAWLCTECFELFFAASSRTGEV